MAILATGTLAPVLQDAYALKADTSNKLSPKAYGEKTKNKLQFIQSTHKSGFESIKKEEVKAYKKISAEYKAKQLLKQLYRT